MRKLPPCDHDECGITKCTKEPKSEPLAPVRPESAGWVEYYYKHFFRGVEMARGIKITAKTEEEAFERAKADFLKPYYRPGQRGRLDAYHRFELISVTPNDLNEPRGNHGSD